MNTMEGMQLDATNEAIESTEDAYVVLELRDYEMLNTQLFTPSSQYKISVSLFEILLTSMNNFIAETKYR